MPRSSASRVGDIIGISMELTVADSSPKRETPSVQCNLIPETDSWTIFSRPAPVVPVFIRNEAQSLGAIAAPVQAPNSNSGSAAQLPDRGTDVCFGIAATRPLPIKGRKVRHSG